MLAFAYYLLKVSVCSALLFSYYFFALRNKRFHQYNRFYLLAITLFAWLIPLIKIQFWTETETQDLTALRLISVVSNSDALVEQTLKSRTIWNLEVFCSIAFASISTGIFIWLIAGIIRIIALIRVSPKQQRNNVYFVLTDVEGTPFSFFNYIFWNRNIDLEEKEGKNILQHELTHVYEKHTADKLFINSVLIIGWINPVFWLIRKELSMIHEFIADQKTINDGDTTALATMLLKSAYPEHSFTLTNSFFHSPIKRRLTMLTSSKKTSYSYARRLAVLPLLSSVLVFFAFKPKEKNREMSEQFKTEATLQVKVDNAEKSAPKKDFDSTKKTTRITIKTTAESKTVETTKGNLKVSAAKEDTTQAVKPLVILDGVEMSWSEFDKKKIEGNDISSINVLKGEQSTAKYGEKGKNGVIIVTTKAAAEKNPSKPN